MRQVPRLIGRRRCGRICRGEGNIRVSRYLDIFRSKASCFRQCCPCPCACASLFAAPLTTYCAYCSPRCSLTAPTATLLITSSLNSLLPAVDSILPPCSLDRLPRGHCLAIEAAKSELEDADESLATETRPLLASYYGNRAAAFTMILKYRDAIEDCDAALAVDPTFTKAHTRKGKLQMTLGDLDGAKKSFSLGMIRDPNDSAMLKQKEEVDTMQKRYGIAVDMLEKVRSGTSGSFVRRDSMQALRQIEIVLAACPEWNEAGLIKVEALINLDRSEEAYALSTKLLRKGMGQSSTLLLLRARCLFNMGNLDDSLKHLRQILQGDPDNKPAFKLLKELRSLSKKKEEADTAYKSRNFEGARD